MTRLRTLVLIGCLGSLVLIAGAAPAAVCGDGTRDAGEQCDLGAQNGAANTCCTAACTYATPSSVCRPAAGECDAAEYCTGSSATCPADDFEPEGTDCTDDGSLCTADQCDDEGNCVHVAAPRDDCTASTPTQILLAANEDTPEKNRFQWKFAATDVALESYGDPTADTRYELCVFDESDDEYTLALDLPVAAGGTCGAKPCWKALRGGKGFVYVDKQRNANGVAALWLRVKDGAGYIFVKGAGANLPMPEPVDDEQMFAQDPGVYVQLINDNDACWEGNYAPPAVVNKGSIFRAKQ